MNAAMITALAALAGSAIGALASFGTTWLTEHHQDRIQRRAQESARREKLFAEFIVQASKLYVDALTHDRSRSFNAGAATERADEVLWLIIDHFYRPNVAFHSREDVQSGSYDVLQTFAKASGRNSTDGSFAAVLPHAKTLALHCPLV